MTALMLILFLQLPNLMPVHTITWAEFKGAIPKATAYSAETAYDWDMDIETGSDSTIAASVKCYFQPYKSWTKVSDADVLRHENLHLQIASIYANQLNKAFKAVSGCKRCEETINAMYQSAWNKMNSEQDLYDSETSHSRNKSTQLAWEDKIKRLLK